MFFGRKYSDTYPSPNRRKASSVPWMREINDNSSGGFFDEHFSRGRWYQKHQLPRRFNFNVVFKDYIWDMIAKAPSLKSYVLMGTMGAPNMSTKTIDTYVLVTNPVIVHQKTSAKMQHQRRKKTSLSMELKNVFRTKVFRHLSKSQ